MTASGDVIAAQALSRMRIMMNSKFTVYFDGDCPLCRREIAFYRRRRGADAIDWVNLRETERDLGPGLTCAAALERFHIKDENGALKSGAQAFVALWRRLPGFRSFAQIADMPGASSILEWLYRGFLGFRPILQKAARESTRRSNPRLRKQ